MLRSSCHTLFWKSVPFRLSRSWKVCRVPAKYASSCLTASTNEAGICWDGLTASSFDTETATIPSSSPLIAVIPSGVCTNTSSMLDKAFGGQRSLHIKQMLFGVVRRPHQGAAFHILEAHSQPYFLVVLEL